MADTRAEVLVDEEPEAAAPETQTSEPGTYEVDDDEIIILTWNKDGKPIKVRRQIEL